MTILGIDSGMHQMACAIVRDGKLGDVWTVKVPDSESSLEACATWWYGWANGAVAVNFDVVAIEVPDHLKKGAESNELAMSLAKVAFCAGTASGGFEQAGRQVYPVFPRQWKGNASKDDTAVQVAGLISKKGPRTTTQKLKATYTEHEIDAIGIAFWKDRQR